MTSAVAYARFSSNNQREESIDAQLRAINEYCGRNGIVISETYTDEAVSGKTDSRDDFQRMIDAVMHRKIPVDVILVHKFNRFARNKYDSALYKKKLKDIGVKVISVTQNIEDTPEGDMMESFLEAMDEYYSANLAVEVRKGLRENALKAKHTGGLAPFGFALDENNMYIPGDDAHIVKKIFEDYAAGIPRKVIVDNLNASGIRNQKGTAIKPRTVYDILRNEKYIGNYIYTLDKRETIRIDGIISPIIERELWDKAQTRHKATKPKHAQNSRKYHITGKAFCACCGCTIVGNGSRTPPNSTKRYYYYACTGKTKLKNGCDNLSINKEWLEDYVFRALLEIVLDDAQVKRIATLAAQHLEKSRQAPAVSSEKLQRELSTIHEQQARLTKLYLAGKIEMQILDAENDEMSRRKSNIETELQARQHEKNEHNIDANVLYDFVKTYIEKVKFENASDNAEFARVLFSTFLDRVEIDKETVNVRIRADIPLNAMGDNVRLAGVKRALSPITISTDFMRKKSVYARKEPLQ